MIRYICYATRELQKLRKLHVLHCICKYKTRTCDRKTALALMRFDIAKLCGS